MSMIHEVFHCWKGLSASTDVGITMTAFVKSHHSLSRTTEVATLVGTEEASILLRGTPTAEIIDNLRLLYS